MEVRFLPFPCELFKRRACVLERASILTVIEVGRNAAYPVTLGRNGGYFSSSTLGGVGLLLLHVGAGFSRRRPSEAQLIHVVSKMTLSLCSADH